VPALLPAFPLGLFGLEPTGVHGTRPEPCNPLHRLSCKQNGVSARATFIGTFFAGGQQAKPNGDTVLTGLGILRAAVCWSYSA
jgi:hypothetical protein